MDRKVNKSEISFHGERYSSPFSYMLTVFQARIKGLVGPRHFVIFEMSKN